MAKKRRKIDRYLHKRKQSPEAALEEGARISNRLFRFVIGTTLTAALIAIVVFGRDTDLERVQWMGIAALISITVGFGTLCLQRLDVHVFERPASFNQFVFLTILFLIVNTFFVLHLRWSPFLTPVPLFAMMFAMAYSQPVALLLSSALAVSVGLMNPVSEELLWQELSLILVLGAVTSVLGLRRIRRQSRPVIIGFYAGISQAVGVLAVRLTTVSDNSFTESLSNTEFLEDLLRSPAWAFTGGVVSGAILTCLLPFVERLLGVLTERRLLDLEDPSNEVLRALMERAPGTYQHSLGVSLLASGAAEVIDADPLLTRVGAYYHDIGKMVKPQYFVENMGEDKSIHDRLRPSISKMIIISHVKEGIQLAKEAGLPQKIVDMIPMHHGTTVVEFFFYKAKQTREREEGEPGEVEYRYPGPKPRFREAALLMLADSVEARAKVESHPNPNRFRMMVHEEIHKRLLDGQLDESDLTLNDLRVIEDSFVRTLTTMYHGRIKYPSGDDSSGVGRGPPLVPTRLAGDAHVGPGRTIRELTVVIRLRVVPRTTPVVT